MRPLCVQEGMKTHPLDAIEIPVPCQASWDDMKGDDRIRHCRLCRHNVYNLSEMTRKEAEALLEGAEGRVCVRLYRRQDGKVLSRNCRAVRRMRQAARALVSTAAALLLGFLAWASGSAAVGLGQGGLPAVKRREPFRTIQRWIEGPPPSQMIMGTPLPNPGP